MKIEIFKRSDAKFDFRIVSSNGNILCTSSQGYENYGDCKRTAQIIKAQASFADIVNETGEHHK